MGKVTFYATLFTLFMWLGGIMPVAQSAPQSAQTAVEQAHQEVMAQAGDTHEAVAGAHDAHAEAGHEQPFILDVDLMSAIVNLIVFLLLLAILAKFVWPPILKGLQDREGKIRSDLESAERANREAAATLSQYKAQLAEAQREAQRVIEQSKQDAQRVAAQLKEQAQNEITASRQRAENEIRTAKEQALAEIYEQTANLATQVAGQILQREIRPEDQQALVQQSLGRLGAARN